MTINSTFEAIAINKIKSTDLMRNISLYPRKSCDAPDRKEAEFLID